MTGAGDEADGDGDEALLEQAGRGDGAAFGRLFRAHADAVYAYCFHRLGTWSAAEDATSVVFLEAWRRRADVVTVSVSGSGTGRCGPGCSGWPRT